MLNALIAIALAVTFVVAAPSALAGADVESTTIAEVVEDLEPDLGTLVSAAVPVTTQVARRFDGADAADPAIASALPPPVPPPERQR